jgi:hypothetical protein
MSSSLSKQSFSGFIFRKQHSSFSKFYHHLFMSVSVVSDDVYTVASDKARHEIASVTAAVKRSFPKDESRVLQINENVS